MRVREAGPFESASCKARNGRVRGRCYFVTCRAHAMYIPPGRILRIYNAVNAGVGNRRSVFAVD